MKIDQCQLENDQIELVKQNLSYLSQCVHSLNKAKKNYSESQYRTFSEVLQNEHDLFQLEFNTDFKLLSHQEQKNFHDKIALKKLKISSRIAANKTPVQELKEMRQFELVTRELWNKIQMQLRIKILYTDVRLESIVYSKYEALLDELNGLMPII